MLAYFHLETLLPRLFAFLIAMTFHDAAHAGAAWLLGDRTARENHRLSLNPLAHLDALGLAMIVFGPYGWSKRIPVDPARFRWRPKLSNTLVYAAGPFMNLLLVLLFWWLYFFLPSLFGGSPESVTIEEWRVYLQYCIIVNLLIGLIHLLPLYPLDGWYILRGLFSDRNQGWFTRNERYGLLLVLILMITPLGQWGLAHIYPMAAHLVMNIFAL
ncbi:site-2 protease family protein [Paenibacillus aestuarii]|uniref:Site-2 protease family protein n=1 Tax=Paenibacillus aestuarii TaxID=516965 RepID=A0ABW0K483_9BACL|nr:site-2 protease family protein [Paenibacillus aestuarii]